MTAKTNILEGLHVLLVSEDEARIAALAKALRDRKASVGDVKVRTRDALALRGADLVVIDTRSLESTKASVNEMRSDVRARWASVAQMDFEKLVLDDGTVLLTSLENEVAPLVSADKELTERARNEESFSVSLRPLGPSRMLRALAAAGPTMHVEIFHETLSGSVDLSNELLVCAFAERGTSVKWEAWTALVRILGLLDATVHVSRKSHPSAMNIMEPIDQALEVAAQERHSSAELIAMEERTARARVVDDGARTGDHPAMRADGSFVKIEPAQAKPEPAVEAPPALASEKIAPSPKRTLLGVAAPDLPSDLPALAKPKAQSRYAYHSDGAGEKTRPSPSRTLLGVAPGALPALGGMPRPVVNLAVPNIGQAKAEPAPLPAPPMPAAPLPVPANTQTAPEAPAKGFVEEQPTSRHPVMLDVAREAFAAADKQAARHEARTVPLHAVEDVDEDRPTTMPPTAFDSEEPEETLVASSKEMQALREESGQIAVKPAPDLMALDDDLPADLSATPPSHLLDAIGEEVATAAFSDPPGAKPIAPAEKKPREPMQAAITRFVRKPRTLYLLVLMLMASALAYSIVWTQRRTEELEAQIRALSVSNTNMAEAAAVAPAQPSQVAPPEANADAGGLPPAAQAPAGTAAAGAAPAEAPGVPSAAQTPAPGTDKAIAAATEAAKPAAEAGKPATTPEIAKTPAADPAPAPVAAKEAPKPVAVEPEEPAEDATGAGDTDFVKTGAKLLAAGNASGARDEFARAVAADAKNAHAREGLAESLIALGEHRDGLVQIEEAIKLRPKRARYRVVQGDALQALGKPSLARDAWQKALELDPSDRDAKKRLGL